MSDDAIKFSRMDYYTGTAAALVASGIVTLDQLPGQPGRPSMRVLYHCGKEANYVRRIDHQPDPENWRRITRIDDDKYKVDAGISQEEIRRRRQEDKPRTATSFLEFMDKTLEPGPIMHGNKPIDVRRMEEIHPFTVKELLRREIELAGAAPTEPEAAPAQTHRHAMTIPEACAVLAGIAAVLNEDGRQMMAAALSRMAKNPSAKMATHTAKFIASLLEDYGPGRRGA